MRVIDYERAATGELRRVADDHPQLIFESHSTDYQTPGNLKALVETTGPSSGGPGADVRDAGSPLRTRRIEDELFSRG